MSRLPALALLIIGLALAPALAAEPRPAGFLVIVHPDNALDSLSREQLAQLFLKRQTRWEDGDATDPVDQRDPSEARAAFSEQVLRRPVSAVRAYWQQRLFSGREVPPPERDGDAQVIEYVRSHPGAVGYVHAGADVRAVKVLRITE